MGALMVGMMVAWSLEWVKSANVSPMLLLWFWYASCSVAIFPLDDRAVPLADGSLPVMSYWYGSVVEIYMKAVGHTQVCVYAVLVAMAECLYSMTGCVAWYSVVLQESGFRRPGCRVRFKVQTCIYKVNLHVLCSLAACVGEYELVLSNHTSIVDMCCVEGACFASCACWNGQLLTSMLTRSCHDHAIQRGRFGTTSDTRANSLHSVEDRYDIPIKAA
jgi:hypothetical protein